MPETTSNVEFAHRIHEHGHSGGGHSHRGPWQEILEAVILASVAVLTAWSGYQAARWDAKSAASYASSSLKTVQAQAQAALAGQEHLSTTAPSGPGPRRALAATTRSPRSSSGDSAPNTPWRSRRG